MVLKEVDFSISELPKSVLGPRLRSLKEGCRLNSREFLQTHVSWTNLYTDGFSRLNGQGHRF